MTPVVRPWRLNANLSEVWELDDFMSREASELNRDSNSAFALADQLRREADLFLVAWDGKRIAGFVALTRGGVPGYLHTASLRVHVGRDYRGSGVGTKLLERALFWADRNDIIRVEATPYLAKSACFLPGLPSAAKFLQRHGFTLEGRKRSAVRGLDGELFDIAVMARVAYDPYTREENA